MSALFVITLAVLDILIDCKVNRFKDSNVFVHFKILKMCQVYLSFSILVGLIIKTCR